MQQKQRADVCVRGQGAVGMSLALGLSGLGLRVVWQRRPATAQRDDVRAYALNDTSIDLLRALKVWDALPTEARTAVRDMRIEGDAGAALGFSAWALKREALAWIVDAGSLEGVLEDALRYAPHVQAMEGAQGNTAQADVPANLLVIAEGRDARSRTALGVATEARAYGHRAVAARLVASLPHAGLARQWFHQPDVLALLPFDRPQRDSSYGLVWSVPEARAQQLAALPAEAFEAELAQATGGAVGELRLASPRASWPLQWAQSRPVCGPGWVLVGDAAHVVHPLAGQGLNLGLADVASLLQTLADREPWRSLGDERLLRRHARRRHGPTQAMGWLTDGLFDLFASEAPLARSARNRGLSLLEQFPPAKRLLAARAFDS